MKSVQSVLSLLSSTLILTLAACGPLDDPSLALEDEAMARSEVPIVNGTPHYGHPAVGALVSQGGGGSGLCTATLVGVRSVITASHCIRPGSVHYFVVNNKYWRASSVKRHPDYAPPNTNHDIGVVRLEKKPPVKPASLSSAPPAVGQILTLIGYGATSSAGGGSGTKRIAQNKVAYLSPSRIVINGSSGGTGNLCFGDSGGPSFATIGGNEVQVGVHSTISGACGKQGHDIRVDKYLAWFEQNAGGDVSKDGKPSPLDDNEPPKVSITAPQADEVRSPLKIVAKVSDNKEVVRVELLINKQKKDSRTKPPWEFSVKLNKGTNRIGVAAYDKAGNRGEDERSLLVLPPAGYGEPCNGHDNCASKMCASMDGSPFCTQYCDPARSPPCPENAECLPGGGGTFVCGPPRPNYVPPSSGGTAGGCSLAPVSQSAPPVVLLAALGLLAVLARRPRGRG